MMTFLDILTYCTYYLVPIIANVTVAYHVFPLWRALRLRFFLILGYSALLGLFLTGTMWALEYHSMSARDYFWLWYANAFLCAVDTGLYAVGVVSMVRHFQSLVPVSAVASSDPVPNP